ncbi:unnamed protein product [Leptosia nina]|uniref:Uncharacterized protein n=1 Tax=Leptosia nina TaxID=320188 RepID=A0AAV1IZ83_9NEOP
MNTSSNTSMQQMATASIAACSPSLAAPLAAQKRAAVSVALNTRALIVQCAPLFTLQYVHYANVTNFIPEFFKKH